MTHAELLEDIRKHPERHKHADLGQLQSCCVVNGAIDLMAMEYHETYASQGTNGGKRCDVRTGPCSCGAWH